MELMLDGMLEFGFDQTTEAVYGRPGVRKTVTIHNRVHSICLFIPVIDVTEPGYRLPAGNPSEGPLKGYDNASTVSYCFLTDFAALRPLLVLSRVDQFDPLLTDPEHYANMYELDRVQELLVERVSLYTGLPIQDIILQINYHRHSDINPYLTTSLFISYGVLSKTQMLSLTCLLNE